MVKICPYCGFENLDNSNFCSKCGRTLLFKEKNVAIDYKNLIIVSYVLTIVFSWGGLIFNKLFNDFGFIGFIGLFLPFYLIQSKNPIAKKHGYIQIAISLVGIFLTSVFVFNIFI
ncbi:MAG: zinc-ribbon domain-containing protein [Methanobrevibacter sp.]|nr:zinc-ribbon domain-containing protein [Methanobrevibacter sp.]